MASNYYFFMQFFEEPKDWQGLHAVGRLPVERMVDVRPSSNLASRQINASIRWAS